MAAVPSLTVAQIVALHRGRYPDALVCVECGALLSTLAVNQPGITQAQRAGYVCAECRQDAATGARADAARRANLAAARAVRGDTRSVLRDPIPDPQDSDKLQRGYSVTARPLARRRKSPGRPRLSAEVLRQHDRERKRRSRAAHPAAA